MLSSRLLEVCELARHLLLLNTWPTVLVMAALGSSISASLAMTVLGALVFVVCSLANVVPEVGIMASLNVSRAAGSAVRLGLAGAGAAGPAEAGAAAQHSGGSVAVSPPGASRAGQVGAGWAGAAAQRLAWQPGSVALPLSVAAGAGQAGTDGQGGVPAREPCRPGGAERTGVPGGPGGEVQAARQVY